MIYIVRNSVNQVVLSLSENVTFAMPYFVFSFQPLATLDEYQPLIYFTSPDLSNYTDRYNLFEITEDDNGSTNGGDDIALYLKPGQYAYNAYESLTGDLDPNTFGTLLETGKMIVGDMTTPGEDTGVLPIYQ